MRMDSMKLHKRTKDITLMRHTSLQEDVETYFRNSAVHGDFRQWLVDRSDLQDKPLYPRHAVVFVTEGRYDRLHWIEAAQLLNTAALVPADSFLMARRLTRFTSARPVTLRCPYEWVQITEMCC
ncbi:hypothetical protein Q5P01_000877 [Channa striata]|uniref:Uncharacterized protein n=1 Tax=Channa striata TaxID=64152 RepID=A0AA88II54_CHASR|nr:hypothetical protein Q5P01_000877 [Channa striata]